MSPEFVVQRKHVRQQTQLSRNLSSNQMVFIDFFLRPRIGNNKTRQYDLKLPGKQKKKDWYLSYQTKRNLEIVLEIKV